MFKIKDLFSRKIKSYEEEEEEYKEKEKEQS